MRLTWEVGTVEDAASDMVLVLVVTVVLTLGGSFLMLCTSVCRGKYKRRTLEQYPAGQVRGPKEGGEGYGGVPCGPRLRTS